MQDMSIRSEKDVLDSFKSLLVGRVLSNREAEVYITLINLGQATAAEISDKIKSKPKMVGAEKISMPSVYTTLDSLERKSFVKSALKPGIKSHSKPYKAISPEEALSDYFNETEQLKDIANQVVTLLELKERQGKVNKQDIWMHETKKIALKEGLKLLEGARKNIMLYCNDYSWVEEPGIAELLSTKMAEGLDLKILGGQPALALQASLKDFDTVRRETSIPCNPYCVIDDEHLLTFLNDGFNPKLLVTRNTYQVVHDSAQFKEIWDNHSKKGAS